MLRELVKWVLNNYLSNYVENLSVDQLSVALLQGEVELENVPLRKDAFHNLRLPVCITAGQIGTIRLQIPVSSIRTAPWVIIIEKLYLTASPYKTDEIDPKFEEQLIHDDKLRRLDTLEAIWRAEHQTEVSGASSSFYSSSCGSWISFTSGLVSNIVENVQLKIKDVHIRYEDDASVPGTVVAAGLTVRALTANTCNSSWTPGYVPLDASADAFKLVELTDAAVYWDTNATTYGNLPLNLFSAAMQTAMQASKPDSFILSPVSAQARLKRNRSELPLRSRNQPRIACDLMLETIQFAVTDVQYAQMVGCSRGLEAISLQREALVGQTSCPRNDVQALWRWAFWRALSLGRVSERYIEVYTQYLLMPNSFSPEAKLLKETIEMRYGYEALRELRETAMQIAAAKLVDIETKGWSVPGAGVLLQWFPLWTGWYSTPALPDQPLKSPDESQRLEDELLHALSDSVESSSILKRDAVFSISTLTIKQGSFKLLSSTKPSTDTMEEDESDSKSVINYPVMDLEVEALKVQLESRPRLNSQCFSLSVGGIYLKDCLTRNSLYPMVVEPLRTAKAKSATTEPLFSLMYETKPFGSRLDHRLHIDTRCLTVVYNPGVAKAISDFFIRPQSQEPLLHLGQAARRRYEQMKKKTKERLMQNWEQMLEGNERIRQRWELKLNISAPQLLLVENFTDKSATVVLLDLGRLSVRNLHEQEAPTPALSQRQGSSESDEDFHTPCSSPQAVEEEPKGLSLDLATELALQSRVYDRYSIELGDTQILVGRTRDNLRHAHLRGSSSGLHVLDKFNISVQLERRALPSCDPNLPSLKVSGNLPKLVVHVNEQKVTTMRRMVRHMLGEGLPSPFRPPESPIENRNLPSAEAGKDMSPDTAYLCVFRFCIDDMSLEVQSRGRSVAELQVRGVRAGLVLRPLETSVSLSIHSLLLVDAMQTYGNDFDLLLASHQRVGMDSVSGSLFDSEPTSPTSPASPNLSAGRFGPATSPHALTQALSTLQFLRATSPNPATVELEGDALIVVELVWLDELPEEEGKCIATVHFNCLDVIANQETIVELVGFVKRLFPEGHSSATNFGTSIDNLTGVTSKVDLNFDFQRLNVLLLRAVMNENHQPQARKIATATLTEAKIQATVGAELSVKGSLGGLQILDLTPEGQKHQRILSLGHDPLAESHPDHRTEVLRRLNAELSSMYQQQSGCASSSITEEDSEAFMFSVTRNADGRTSVGLRMASVWFTHSPRLLLELQSCATEFKQYVSKLARSIRSAAAEMAIGLMHVHARVDPASERGSRLSLATLEMSPQRRRRRSMSQSLELLENKLNTPFTPDEEPNDIMLDTRLDIVLESPVIVLPRAANSGDVLVAHLGKITLKDDAEPEADGRSPDSDICGHYCWGIVRRRAKYNLEIRDMNLASLNIDHRRKAPENPGETLLQRADVLYSCKEDALPILHNTVIKLAIEIERGRCVMKPTESLPSLLLDQSMDFLDVDSEDTIQIRGSVVQDLKLSLSRAQYEQLLDSLEQIAVHEPETPRAHDRPPESFLTLDPSMKARLTTPLEPKHLSRTRVDVLFELPALGVTLRGQYRGDERPVAEIGLRDLRVQYLKTEAHETSLEVSLRALLVEDLLQAPESPHRMLVVSQFVPQEEPIEPRKANVSRSCPDLSSSLLDAFDSVKGSLPDLLETSVLYGAPKKQQPESNCPCTPPPSPRRTMASPVQDNLVHVDVRFIDPKCPEFFSKHKGVQQYMDVNFNCLDLIVNIESWVVILDFFGLGPETEGSAAKRQTPAKRSDRPQRSGDGRNSLLNIRVRSLTLVLVKTSGGELARANASHLIARVERRGPDSTTTGKLGKLSLMDASPHGRLYRERFISSGGEALDFTIINYGTPDPTLRRECDAQVRLQMSSVFYVHTQRFVEELKILWNHFSLLQTLMSRLREATAGFTDDEPSSRGRRILWDIQAGSPVILLPLSSRSTKVLMADLGELTVKNGFRLHSDCLLDVMDVNLINMDIVASHRLTSYSGADMNSAKFRVGNTWFEKVGVSLLSEAKCQLCLRVERNLDSLTAHPVPDLSVQGTLSGLHASIGVEQLRLIKGLLAHNIGENLDELDYLLAPTPPGGAPLDTEQVWVSTSLKLDLRDVLVALQQPDGPLALINFVKCQLVVESRSDGARDIDLVSKEILITDQRFQSRPVNKRPNVFNNILLPVDAERRSSQVQAEIHHRRTACDGARFTILLNNMRLMLILDWWRLVRDFISAEPDELEFASPSAAAPATVQPAEEPYELTLNITDSDVVLVEDCSRWETNALILKSTTVVSYRPSCADRPLTCNLNRCELLYCILGDEQESAVSIIDPVTVNLDLVHTEDGVGILDVTLQTLSLRLSYRDARAFSQLLSAVGGRDRSNSIADEGPKNILQSVERLCAMGFSAEDCADALDRCGGRMDDAALWLTQHAKHTYSPSPESPSHSSEGLLKFRQIELKTHLLSVCIIDDCQDADVPLLELSLAQLSMKQLLGTRRTLDGGHMECHLAVDYYNRLLSGWEPLVEPWRAKFSWEWQELVPVPFFRLHVDADNVLALNVTDSLVSLVHAVKDTWTQDLNTEGVVVTQQQPRKRRSPFVPYQLLNDTGSDLWFTTNVRMADAYDPLGQEHPQQTNEGWTLVMAGEKIPFDFERQARKLRHRNSHELRVHQVRVRIAGWRPIQPVSVDRVGVYFRHAQPDLDDASVGQLPSARVVFQVTLEGCARKVVTVRSALLLLNRLPIEVELCAEQKRQRIAPNATLAVPMMLVHSTLKVRPLQQEHFELSASLQWSHVSDPGSVQEESYVCRSTRSHHSDDGFRFTLAVQRELYPPEKQYPQWTKHRSLTYMYPQPAHTLILLSPIIVNNLLPHELECKVRSAPSHKLSIAAGTSAALNFVDISESQSLHFLLDNFTASGQLELQPYGGSSRQANLFLTDPQGRVLVLHARIRVCIGRGCEVDISAPYWLINRTGLPVVLKQEGASQEAAGQGMEHELARMVAPLIFSLSDPEQEGTGFTIRLGTGLRQGSRPDWSKPLLPRRDVQLVQLRLGTANRPDELYELGVSTKPGRGRYRRTTMVHLAPRYLLHNKSSRQLEFAQSFLATTVTDLYADASHVQLVPGCCVPFHWPKLDKEHRLCVRMPEVFECSWSGSFYINRTALFHLNVRDRSGRMNFLSVEVTEQEASFVIVFSDVSMPSPVRVDNFSEVPINFYQGGARVQQTVVRPHCCLPYTWDEPLVPHKLTCIAPGGNEATLDLGQLDLRGELTYDNFIYVAMTWTFPPADADARIEPQCQQLVLDVPEGNRVVLRKKEHGCRSQLWRLTADGHLQHEGSGPPRDPRKLNDPFHQSLVLDIAGPAPQPSQYVPLVIRRPEPRRQSTQTWRFTEDGRLRCAHNSMCVQAKDGFFGLRRGSEVVLGPPQPICHQKTDDGVPVEQAVAPQKLRPGSGVLVLRVYADGPTRVLEIADKKLRRTFSLPRQRDWSPVFFTRWGSPASQDSIQESTSGVEETAEDWGFCVQVRLTGGLGVSLIDTNIREELAFCLLECLSVRVSAQRNVHRLEASVLNIHVDNQMLQAQCPVVAFVPSFVRSEDTSACIPVVEVTAERIAATNHNIDTIKNAAIIIRNLNLTIEEEQLLLVLSLFGLGVPETEPNSTATAAGAEGGDLEAQRGLTALAEQRMAAQRYFFSRFFVAFTNIRLSAVTTNNLPPRLKHIKRRIGLTLIKFEDAGVELSPFHIEHELLSQPALLDELTKHFQAALRGQLPIILFSSDIFGGATGLVSNVTEGVVGVLCDPGVKSVGGLVKNVTHGLSSSTAKVTGSLSDGVSWVALDEYHEECRQRIRRRPPAQTTSWEHVKVGLRSLGFGFLGGATSIFTQAYEGAATEGTSGLIYGLGRGLVGTVTKPVMGSLDFVSDIASAVSNSSRSSSHYQPSRFRLPRCIVGPGGLLPVYSHKQSEGQQFLHQINNNLFLEIFMAYELLRSGTEDLRVIVSSEAVRVFTTSTNGSCAIVVKVHLGELQNCRPIQETDANNPSRVLHYVELSEQVEGNKDDEEPQMRRPRVRCDTEETSKWVSQQIIFAKGMYEERIRTLATLPDLDD
ncbi:intermembrane lipid transfer protein VPS13D isoform X2 [Neocloeon triangulifer]|uniref:intermembrane lipid transfer protein VPS13D isoform X2 n=1 Tax=Neocloeon triangulifer TaxID=2078957 RepID=UPI00286F2CE0|nr:intermembrane lipid transfer protein VPS13D isoform X2 [Neocloeon triangulifer]